MRNSCLRPRLPSAFFVRSYPMSGEQRASPSPLEGEGRGGGGSGTDDGHRPDRPPHAAPTGAVRFFLHGRTPCPVRNTRRHLGQRPTVTPWWKVRISSTEDREESQRSLGRTAGGPAIRFRARSRCSASSVRECFVASAPPANDFSSHRDPMPGEPNASPSPLEGEGRGGGCSGTDDGHRHDRTSHTAPTEAVRFLHGPTPCPVRKDSFREAPPGSRGIGPCRNTPHPSPPPQGGRGRAERPHDR